MKAKKERVPVRVEEFAGFKEFYTYRRARTRADGIVRVHGFADMNPPAWEFMLNHRGVLHAIMRDEGDGEETLMRVIDINGKLNRYGRELCWRLMPADVQRAVEAFGGKRP